MYITDPVNLNIHIPQLQPEVVINHIPVNVDIDRHYIINVQPDIQVINSVETNHIVNVVV